MLCLRLKPARARTDLATALVPRATSSARNARSASSITCLAANARLAQAGTPDAQLVSPLYNDTGVEFWLTTSLSTIPGAFKRFEAAAGCKFQSSSKFRNFLAEHGSCHETLQLYSPQAKGVVEQIQTNVLESVILLLNQAQAPKALGQRDFLPLSFFFVQSCFQRLHSLEVSCLLSVVTTRTG